MRLIRLLIAVLALVGSGCGGQMYVGGDVYPVARPYGLVSGWAYVTGDPVLPPVVQETSLRRHGGF